MKLEVELKLLSIHLLIVVWSRQRILSGGAISGTGRKIPNMSPAQKKTHHHNWLEFGQKSDGSTSLECTVLYTVRIAVQRQYQPVTRQNIKPIEVDVIFFFTLDALVALVRDCAGGGGAAAAAVLPRTARVLAGGGGASAAAGFCSTFVVRRFLVLLAVGVWEHTM
jgi:hypothetical protein